MFWLHILVLGVDFWLDRSWFIHWTLNEHLIYLLPSINLGIKNIDWRTSCVKNKTKIEPNQNNNSEKRTRRHTLDDHWTDKKPQGGYFVSFCLFISRGYTGGYNLPHKHVKNLQKIWKYCQEYNFYGNPKALISYKPYFHDKHTSTRSFISYAPCSMKLIEGQAYRVQWAILVI